MRPRVALTDAVWAEVANISEKITNPHSSLQFRLRPTGLLLGANLVWRATAECLKRSNAIGFHPIAAGELVESKQL